jgi:hypothetical protein
MVDLQNKFLTVEQLAERLQVKPSWVYAHADQLRVSRLGKYLRFYWPHVLEGLGLPSSPLSHSQRIDPES